MFGIDLGAIVALIAIVVAIMGLLMPFFVLRIRNDVIAMRKQLDAVHEVLLNIQYHARVLAQGKAGQREEGTFLCTICKKRYHISMLSMYKGQDLCPECFRKIAKKAAGM